jgi:FKBP-type peptidyl-prolyl cis-trans isomerase
MRRTILRALAVLVAGLVVPAGASAAEKFAFPKVSRDITTKPEIGRAHGHAPKRLRTKDIVVGTGRTARPGDVVEAQYVGVLYRGGQEFDASWDRHEAFAFDLGAGMVIAGWDRGVKGMKVGGRRVLVVPARLAYGRRGSPPAIPPRATLIFAVDLVAIHRPGDGA